jgi:hypothetical protein
MEKITIAILDGKFHSLYFGYAEGCGRCSSIDEPSTFGFCWNCYYYPIGVTKSSSFSFPSELLGFLIATTATIVAIPATIAAVMNAR